MVFLQWWEYYIWSMFCRENTHQNDCSDSLVCSLFCTNALTCSQVLVRLQPTLPIILSNYTHTHTLSPSKIHDVSLSLSLIIIYSFCLPSSFWIWRSSTHANLHPSISLSICIQKLINMIVNCQWKQQRFRLKSEVSFLFGMCSIILYN